MGHLCKVTSVPLLKRSYYRTKSSDLVYSSFFYLFVFMLIVTPYKLTFKLFPWISYRPTIPNRNGITYSLVHITIGNLNRFCKYWRLYLLTSFITTSYYPFYYLKSILNFRLTHSLIFHTPNAFYKSRAML